MSTYDLVVFVHVLSAIMLVGGGLLATPAVHSAIRRADTVADLRRWLTVGKPLGRINPISSMALLASGVFLASVGHWWTHPWVQVAVAMWIVNAVLANALVNPALDRIARLGSDTTDETIGPGLDAARKSPQLVVTSDVLLATDLGVLFLMVAKPSGYLASLMAVVIAQVAVLGVRAFRRPALVSDRVSAE